MSILQLRKAIQEVIHSAADAVVWIQVILDAAKDKNTIRFVDEYFASVWKFERKMMSRMEELWGDGEVSRIVYSGNGEDVRRNINQSTRRRRRMIWTAKWGVQPEDDKKLFGVWLHVFLAWA